MLSIPKSGWCLRLGRIYTSSASQKATIVLSDGLALTMMELVMQWAMMESPASEKKALLLKLEEVWATLCQGFSATLSQGFSATQQDRTMCNMQRSEEKAREEEAES